jgi:hypothetical protein
VLAWQAHAPKKPQPAQKPLPKRGLAVVGRRRGDRRSAPPSGQRHASRCRKRIYRVVGRRKRRTCPLWRRKKSRPAKKSPWRVSRLRRRSLQRGRVAPGVGGVVEDGVAARGCGKRRADRCIVGTSLCALGMKTTLSRRGKRRIWRRS